MTGSKISDFYYASGSSRLIGRVLLKVKRQEDTINVNSVVEFHWCDVYDWDKGKEVGYWPIIIKDDDGIKYEKAGCAKSFSMYTFWHRKFSYIFKKENSLWFKTYSSMSEEIIGRPPVSERGLFIDWKKYEFRKKKYSRHLAVVTRDWRVHPGLKDTREENEVVNCKI